VRCAVESASYRMAYRPRSVTMGSGSQLILKLLSQQFERLQCWYYRWAGLVKYAVEMASGGTKFHDNRITHLNIIKDITSNM
jgi:hypothetical protein